MRIDQIQKMATFSKAMQAPDDFVVSMKYRAKSGEVTERVVSPIRFKTDKLLLALCLGREEPRTFDIDSCTDLVLMPANDVMMPVPIKSEDVLIQGEQVVN